MSSNSNQIEKAINLFMKLGKCKLPPGVDLEDRRARRRGIDPEAAKRLAD